jgi:enoyl-CoA hydratase/carnithine racemase
MAGPTLERTDAVFVLSLGDDENVTGVTWLDEMGRLLDEVEAADGPKALVTTGRGPKHYSNGLDVPYMTEHPDQAGAYVQRVEELLARLLVFPAPTVAAVNGHAFGAGAFLILAHDHAVMREDRGFVCWPEVHLGMPFTRGLVTMVHELLPSRTAREAVVTGRRYSGPAAAAAGVVDAAHSLETLLPAAVAIASAHTATAGPNLSGIKTSLHHAAHGALLGS